MGDSELIPLIGVDGGGTGCRAAIGTRADGILGRAAGGRANASTDPEMAARNVASTVAAAALQAGIPESALHRAIAHIGLAGVMTRADAQRIARGLPYASSTVTDDRLTAVIGALGDDDGFLVSVGTGTIIASARGGQYRFVGGWGFHVADQASGAWLGRAALEQVLLAHDGVIAHSDLTRAVFATFGDDPNAIVTFTLSAQPGDYATHAPAIIDFARSGDPLATALMGKGADFLRHALGALGFQPGATICLTGGVGPHYTAFLPDGFLSGLAHPRGSALDGAFHLARRAAHTPHGAAP